MLIATILVFADVPAWRRLLVAGAAAVDLFTVGILGAYYLSMPQ